MQLMKFDYVNYPSNYSIEKVGHQSHLLPYNKLINLGYPRCDDYFDHDHVLSRFKNKVISKSLFGEMNINSKILLYTPTWRPYDFNFPLLDMIGFDEDKLTQWLEENNIYFIYSMHSVLMPQNKLKDTERVRYLDLNKFPLLDINELMLEVDVLVNDYATTSTEFSILNRPQVFLCLIIKNI